MNWFETNVDGLTDQVSKSGGYIIFPEVGQVGVLFGGGKAGRGMVCREGGIQPGTFWREAQHDFRKLYGAKLGAPGTIGLPVAACHLDKSASIRGSGW